MQQTNIKLKLKLFALNAKYSLSQSFGCTIANAQTQWKCLLTYEARGLLRLGVSWTHGVGQVSLSETDTTPRHITSLNYVIFSKYYRCQHVGVYALPSKIHMSVI